jgi:hypothetical protein
MFSDLARWYAGGLPERTAEVVRAEVGDLGHRARLQRPVHALSHRRDDPLDGQPVRSVGFAVVFHQFRKQ